MIDCLLLVGHGEALERKRQKGSNFGKETENKKHVYNRIKHRHTTVLLSPLPFWIDFCIRHVSAWFSSLACLTHLSSKAVRAILHASSGSLSTSYMKTE